VCTHIGEMVFKHNGSYVAVLKLQIGFLYLGMYCVQTYYEQLNYFS